MIICEPQEKIFIYDKYISDNTFIYDKVIISGDFIYNKQSMEFEMTADNMPEFKETKISKKEILDINIGSKNNTAAQAVYKFATMLYNIDDKQIKDIAEKFIDTDYMYSSSGITNTRS